MAESYSVEAVLSAKDSNFSSIFSKATNTATSFGRKLSGGLGFGILSGIGQAAFNTLSNGFKGLVGSVKESGSAFDSSMSQVAATMGKTMQEMESEVGTVDLAWGTFSGNLREYAQEMGKNTAFSASEAADALNYMALAGYDTEKSMAMLPNVLNLAAAGGMDLAAASDMVTDAASALGLTTEDTTKMVDQMAKASSKSNTSVSQLGEAFLTIGATARNVKGGTQELATVLGVLADNGIKGSEGGTHLRNILLSLQSAAQDGAVDFGNFSVSIYDSEGNMRSMVDIIADMQKGMGEMDQASRDAMISGVFNKTDLASVNALLNTSTTRFNELAGEIDNSSGAAQEMADTMLDNFEGDVTLMKSAWEGFSISLWDKAKSAGRGVVQTFTDMIGDATSAIQNSDFIDKVAGTISNGLNWLMTNVPKAINTIKPYWEVFRDAVSEVGAAFGEAFGAIGTNLGELKGSQSTLESFKTVITAIKDVLIKVAGFIKEHADTIAKLITMLPKLVAAFIAFKIAMTAISAISSITSLLGGFGGAVGGASSKMTQFGQTVMMVGIGILAIAAAFMLLTQVAIQLTAAGGPTIAVFFGMIGAITGLVALMGVFGPQIKEAGSGMALLGVGVLLVAAGFLVMTQAAIQLSAAGGGAIAVFFGMVGAIAGLLAIMGVFGPQIQQAGIGVALLGAGVLMVAAGFTIMTNAAISLTSAGGGAIAVFFGMIAALAGLMVLVTALGPGLVVGGAGALLLGAGLALAGAGALMMASALAIVVAQLPKLSTYGSKGAAAILKLSAGAIALSASLLALGAGAVVGAAGMIAFGAGMLVAVAGTAAMAVALAAVTAEMLIIAGSAKTAQASLDSMKSSVSIVEQGLKEIGSIAKSATDAIISAFTNSSAKVQAAGQQLLGSFQMVTTGAQMFHAKFIEISATMGQMAAAFGKSGSAASTLAKAVMSIAKGLASASRSVRETNNGLNQLSGSTAKTASSFPLMATAASTAGNQIKNAFTQMTAAGTQSMNRLVQTISSAGSRIKTQGTQIGTQFKSSLQSQMNQLNGIAAQAMARFATGIASGGVSAVTAAKSVGSQAVNAMSNGGFVSTAYNAGSQIGNGLARGIASQVSNVARQAQALVNQANIAIQAKAKIGSPSKVTTQFGKWYGEGFGNGIKDMFHYVWGVSEDLVTIPAMANIPSNSNVRNLNDNYAYGRGGTYTIEVPLNIDGREFAKATATYTEGALYSLNIRDERKLGYV